MRIRMRLLCFITIIVLFLTACYPTADIKPLSIKTAAEIEAIYHENETLFQNAAKVLIPYSNNAYFVVQPIGAERGEYNIPIWFYDLDKILIKTSVPLSEAQCQEIRDVTEPLIVELNLLYISSHLDRVRFCIDQGAGKAAELLYLTSDADVTLGFGVEDELYINESWYAAVISD